jgi:hypothetical protein
MHLGKTPDLKLPEVFARPAHGLGRDFKVVGE